VSRKWELNERHYGALTGLAKDDPWLEENFGEDTIVEWRRAYDARPPPMFPTHEHYHPPPAPISESLQDCEKRVAAWFKRCVAPQLKSGDWNNVLIVSHANAIRGLVKTIDDISDENIRCVACRLLPSVLHLPLLPLPRSSARTPADSTAALADSPAPPLPLSRYVKIPNGVPLVYYLDENNRPLKHLPKDSAGFMGAYLSSFANSERVKESLHCEEQWLRAAFEMIDTDGNGEVSVVELVAGLRTLKSDFDVAGDLDVGELVFQLDVNGDGLVSLDEWLASSERLKQFAPETFRLIEADAPPGQRDRNVRNTKLYGARSGRGSIMKGRRRGLRGSSRFEP